MLTLESVMRVERLNTTYADSPRRSISIHARMAKYDPTKTLFLRNAFSRDALARLKELKNIIKQAVVTEDCFGLEPHGFGSVHAMASPTSKGRRAFDFPRSGDKVQAFMDWLRQQEQAGLLEVITMPQYGHAIEEAWTNKYIRSAYERGVERARNELISAGYNIPSMSETGGIFAAMTNPFHADRLGVLFTRDFTELKGITDSMDLTISRVLSQGLADGDAPAEISRHLSAVFSGPSKDLGLSDVSERFTPTETRLKTLVRTEVIRAHHQASIQEYKNWAALGVVVKAEWVTAGFGVCPACLEMEHRGVFPLEEIMNLIPLHPNCRCVAIPVGPGATDEPLDIEEYASYAWSESARQASAEARRSKGSAKSSAQTKAAQPQPEQSKFSKVETASGVETVKEYQKVMPALNKVNFARDLERTENLKERAVTYANKVGEELQRLKDSHPGIATAIEEHSNLLRSVEFMSIAPSGYSKGWVASYNSDYNRIRMKVLPRGSSEDKVTVGHSVVGTGIGFDFRHEFGHAYYERARFYAEARTGQNWNLVHKSLSDREWRSSVSRYSTSNRHEAFAEAFSLYTSSRYGISGKRLPSAVEHYFDRVLGHK